MSNAAINFMSFCHQTDLDVKSKNLVDFSEKFKREATNLNIQSLMAFILGVSMIFLVIVIWFKYLCKKTSLRKKGKNPQKISLMQKI